MANTTVRKSSPAWIAISWLVVTIPAVWGLTFTVQSAMKIFKTGAAPAAAPATPGAPAPVAAAPAR